MNKFKKMVSDDLNYKPAVEVTASPFVSTQIAYVGDNAHVFIANYKGLKRKENAKQIPEEGVKITFSANENVKVYCLPFLGDMIELKTKSENEKLVCTVPEISRGVVVWVQ
jgi:hypothetical protein